jgi:hypothetical protein
MKNSRKNIEKFILEKENLENRKIFETIFKQVEQKNQGIIFLLNEFHNQMKLGELKTSFVGSLYIESQMKISNLKKKSKDFSHVDEFSELYSIYLNVIELLSFELEEADPKQLLDKSDLLSVLAFFEQHQKKLNHEVKDLYNLMCTLVILFRHLVE